MVVKTVAAGSMEEQVGLRKHDVLLEIDGRAVMKGSEVGRRISIECSIKMLRRGKLQNLPKK